MCRRWGGDRSCSPPARTAFRRRRIRRDDSVRRHDPQAHPFHTARIDIARIVDGHFGVRRMHAARMLCDRPFLARMNTSHKGQSLLSLSPSGRVAGAAFFVIGERGVAHPLAVVMGAAAGLQAVRVAGAVAGDDSENSSQSSAP